MPCLPKLRFVCGKNDMNAERSDAAPVFGVGDRPASRVNPPTVHGRRQKCCKQDKASFHGKSAAMRHQGNKTRRERGHINSLRESRRDSLPTSSPLPKGRAPARPFLCLTLLPPACSCRCSSFSPRLSSAPSRRVRWSPHRTGRGRSPWRHASGRGSVARCCRSCRG